MVSARLIRAFLTLTVLAAAWLVALPARAEALTSHLPELRTSAAYEALFSRNDAPPVQPVPATPEWGAPLCDVRGAITFAPPPQMQETEASLDTGLTLDDCLNGGPSRNEHALGASNGRGPLPREIVANGEPAVIHAVAKLRPANDVLMSFPGAGKTCLPSGVRSTVDRPPRL